MRYTHLSLLALSALLLGSCSSKDDSPVQPTPTPTPSTSGRYILAVSAKASGGQSNTLLLSTEQLTKDLSLSVKDGLQIDGGTDYIYLDGDRYLYAIAYHQGGKTTTSSYVLQGGQVVKRSKSFQGNRFTSYGVYQNTLITSSTGVGTGTTADKDGYQPQSFLLSYLDARAETQEQKSLPGAEDFLGDGEFVTLCGLQEHEGKIFAGVIPMGLSQYGANVDAVWSASNTYTSGKWVKKGNEDLVKTADGGSKSSSYKKGELQWTQYPDACHVAIFSGKDLQSKKIISSNKISYPAGRFKSQYHQMIWPSADGDLYVFSPSFAKTMADARQKTTLPAGVLRIKKGTEAFDSSYYFDLDQRSGGRGFQHVFPVGGDRFLIYLFDQSFAKLTNQQLASQLALFEAKTGTWTDVTGLPAGVSEFGGRPLVENGTAYLPVMAKGLRPAVYAIDLKTAQATKQVEVDGERISSIGHLRPLR